LGTHTSFVSIKEDVYYTMEKRMMVVIKQALHTPQWKQMVEHMD